MPQGRVPLLTLWENTRSLKFPAEAQCRRRGMSGTIPWERVRRAGSKLTTPLLPDDYLTLLNPLWSSRELRGRIERVERETDDAATLVIRPGWGWRYDHRPGQYVGIGVQVDGKFQWRSYSVSSAPRRSAMKSGGRPSRSRCGRCPRGSSPRTS